ncbi:hypothetical protein [Hymenobacter jeollabukensis]|uniref:Uncharacterized protein n=1 Tax=Hymenobacter jeollabukensis TaxID=2025313 RepID=A0A5R8WMP4_9BACT|nr:hypothetical protein [Hymenobacter jeollabukensis]TLM91017.1 hypothetical protein FDY95_15560 [Hymenobacter jeollabukensis]
METVIYGYIAEPYYGNRNPEEMRRLNRQCQRFNARVLKSLPVYDEWPPLYRGFFHVFGGFDMPGGYGDYKGRVIPFGGRYKSIEADFLHWLPKFEALLRRLLWEKVRLHVVTEYTFPLTLEWTVPLDEYSTMLEARPLAPPTRWDFSGSLDFFYDAYQNAHRQPFGPRPVMPPPATESGK